MVTRLSRMVRSIGVLGLAVALVGGCASIPDRVARPEFSQRAAPRPGQDEIELLAGLRGRLAISDGCLGVRAVRGEDDSHFTTIVWPWNARLEADGASWLVRNLQTGQAISVGSVLVGSGGFSGDFGAAGLRRYNRYLTRDLSMHCAAKGSFSLNREFKPS